MAGLSDNRKMELELTADAIIRDDALELKKGKPVEIPIAIPVHGEINVDASKAFAFIIATTPQDETNGIIIPLNATQALEVGYVLQLIGERLPELPVLEAGGSVDLPFQIRVVE